VLKIERISAKIGEPVGDVLQYFNSVLHILAIEQLKNVPLLLELGLSDKVKIE